MFLLGSSCCLLDYFPKWTFKMVCKILSSCVYLITSDSSKLGGGGEYHVGFKNFSINLANIENQTKTATYLPSRSINLIYLIVGVIRIVTRFLCSTHALVPWDHMKKVTSQELQTGSPWQDTLSLMFFKEDHR